jgi:hypothetical protein
MVNKPKIHDDSRIQELKKNPGSRAYSLTHDKMGNTVDNLNFRDETTRRYIPHKGGIGVWQNSNGTQLGQSISEDSPMMPSKSTGDIPSTNLGHAIHVHLHGLGDVMQGDFKKAAKLKRKRM